jgi:hypothetical protein
MVVSSDDNEGTDTNPDFEVERLPDPFDPARLALKGNPADRLEVKKALVHVSVRKPNRQEFVRTHPDPAFRIEIAIIELEAEGEIYAVAPEIAEALPEEIKPVMLTTSIDRHGNIFLWPVPLPPTEERENMWNASQREVATIAEKTWVKLKSNRKTGCYEAHVALASHPDPQWPDLSMRNLLALAFSNGRLIDSLEHPVIRQLLGLV